MAKKKVAIAKPEARKPVVPGVESIRKEIDAVDRGLHELINRRALLAQQVGISKHKAGNLVDFYRPEREAEVLRMALARNDGPLRDEEILRLFREIMSACLAQEKPLKVAYLGPEGTFTQQAVLKHFGHSVRALSMASIDEVFQEVQAGNADFGVVPVENSAEGTVNNTLDRFLTTHLHICGEVEMRIHHHLVGRMKQLSDVTRVCSHPQALAQCRGWLDEHLAQAERVPVASNAEGARRARDEKGTAAIGSDVAARDLWTDRAGKTHRGFGRQHDPLPGDRRQAAAPERRGQDDNPHIGCGDRRVRSTLPAARAPGQAQGEHDAHRVATLAAAQVGLRVLHRPGRACRR